MRWQNHPPEVMAQWARDLVTRALLADLKEEIAGASNRTLMAARSAAPTAYSVGFLDALQFVHDQIEEVTKGPQ